MYTQSMPQALRVLCEILTYDPEGGPARIPLEQFEELYKFLTHIDGEVPVEQVHKVMEYLRNDPAYVNTTPVTIMFIIHLLL